MATPRKLKKVRDAEATRRKLVECLGEALRIGGFHSVGVNRIARLAERDKGVIRYHFGSLSGLIRTYIKQKDYWTPFFERYRIDGSAEQFEVRDMFIALMQENLRQFRSDQEMQKIILWQASENHPVLRQVSQEREAEGEKLFALTDPTFAGTGISFKSIIALLLGGSYFAVLQAGAIGTQVCGIDVNWEQDYRRMNDTIAQVISWAFEKAGERKKSIDMPMSYELERLEDIADRIAGDENGNAELGTALRAEARNVERALSSHLLSLTNETQIATFLQLYLSRLVKICDELMGADGESSENAKVVLELIEKVRRPVSNYVPENIVLPRLFRTVESDRFSNQWAGIAKRLIENNIDSRLLEMIKVPLEGFADGSGEATWGEFKYLRRYLSVLESMTAVYLTTASLMELLIGLGFNYSRFSAFYTGRIAKRLKMEPEEGRRSLLIESKSRLSQISIYTSRSFDPKRMGILEELEKWIDGELMKLVEDGAAVAPLKLVTGMKVVELALWYKLQYDHGVFQEDSLDIFSEKIASAVSTKGQEELSPQSIKSKFYPKEQALFRSMEKLLSGMLEDVQKFL